MMNRLTSIRGRRPICAWLIALALAACGGGVDSGGTGRASFTSGQITGFGSVIVEGVHFDDSGASVTDADGTLRSRDDLRLGMTTEIRASGVSTDATGTSIAVASSIAFGSEILGRIDAIDRATSRLTVLGQLVDVNSTTVFDDASVSGGLPALALGDVVEVYALIDAASGRYTATRIERKSGVTVYRLRGVVSQLDTAAKAFNIGAARISYAGVAAPALLANGSFLRVRLQALQVSGVWLVVALADSVPRPRDMDDVRLEGIISAFTSSTLFSVNGVAVDARGANPPAGLALGVRVEVEGTGNGTAVVATQIKIRTPGDVAGQDFELRGAITSVDAVALSFVLRGVTVGYSIATTEFRDGTAANLRAGVNVEARGRLSADGTRLLAERITFK